MLETKVNFTQLRQKINAANDLQEAWDDETCRQVLKDTCKKLLDQLEEAE